jgi:hypothetical protein
MVPRPQRRRIQQSANMLRDKYMSLKQKIYVLLLFISYLKAHRIVDAPCMCVPHFLLHGMMISCDLNRPN